MVNTDGVTGPFITQAFVDHYEQKGDKETVKEMLQSQAAIKRLVSKAQHLSPLYTHNYSYPSDQKLPNRQLRFYREPSDSLKIKICVLGTLDNGKEIGELSQESISVENPINTTAPAVGSAVGSLAMGGAGLFLSGATAATGGALLPIIGYLFWRSYSSNPTVKFSSLSSEEQKTIIKDLSNYKIEVISSKSGTRPFEIASAIIIKCK